MWKYFSIKNWMDYFFYLSIRNTYSGYGDDSYWDYEKDNPFSQSN